MMLSLVIPFYNEAANIAALFPRLEAALAGCCADWEVVCVDDGSRDDTYARLVEQHRRDPRVKLLRLSRNFGKETALTAGLQHASGDAVVILDADLQHPPEVIADFLARWREGYHMVYAVRSSHHREGRLRTLTARLYYWVYAKIAEVPLPPGAGDFRLLDRRVVDALNAMPERTRFMKGLYAWVGFRQCAVPFDPRPRAAGQSGFSLRSLWRLGVNGVMAFSTVPLHIWSLFGLLISALAGSYGLFLVVRTALFGIDVPGYASLMVSSLFIGGIQLISLGVIGEYLGRVFDEVKGRPLYLVADHAGLDRVLRIPTQPPEPAAAARPADQPRT